MEARFREADELEDGYYFMDVEGIPADLSGTYLPEWAWQVQGRDSQVAHELDGDGFILAIASKMVRCASDIVSCRPRDFSETSSRSASLPRASTEPPRVRGAAPWMPARLSEAHGKRRHGFLGRPAPCHWDGRE